MGLDFQSARERGKLIDGDEAANARFYLRDRAPGQGRLASCGAPLGEFPGGEVTLKAQLADPAGYFARQLRRCSRFWITGMLLHQRAI